MVSTAERAMSASAEVQVPGRKASNSSPDELNLSLDVQVINGFEWKST
jgi:hypothetical protein